MGDSTTTGGSQGGGPNAEYDYLMKFLALGKCTLSTRKLIIAQRSGPSKHDTLTQCWVYVGPTSETAGRHKPSIGSMYRV